MKVLGPVLFFVVVVFADQVTKYLALAHLSQNNGLEVIPGFFRLTLVFNPGAAFGMFGGLSDDVRRLVLWLVTLLALFVVGRLFFFEARNDRVSRFALMAVLAGALGNVIDRVRYDAVVDFLDFYFGNYHWPAFNIADSSISIGVLFVAWKLGFRAGDDSGRRGVAQESQLGNSRD